MSHLLPSRLMFGTLALLQLWLTPLATAQVQAKSGPEKSGPQKSKIAQSAKVVPYHGYDKAIELVAGPCRAVLCPQVGGRVLEFSLDGKNAMFMEDAEKSWTPGKDVPVTAGRFDFGPELVVPRHPSIWAGEWTGETVGTSTGKMTSPRDDSAGVQLARTFELRPLSTADAFRMVCKQTITNISQSTHEYCHWGRSFSPGGGICLIPLGDRPSRFPSKYAMYEDGPVINVGNKDPLIRQRQGFLEILAPPRKPKLGFDSYAGWLAYLIPNDLLFVKQFETYPDRVYNEAAGLTISVWYPPGARIELEPIGPRERLQPGQSASFVEDWCLLPYKFPKEGEQVDLAHLEKTVKGLGRLPAAR